MESEIHICVGRSFASALLSTQDMSSTPRFERGECARTRNLKTVRAIEMGQAQIFYQRQRCRALPRDAKEIRAYSLLKPQSMFCNEKEEVLRHRPLMIEFFNQTARRLARYPNRFP